MNDNVFNSLNNLIYVSQIGNLPTLASQIGSMHSVSDMAKKLMEIERSPALSAIEKSLSRYDDILKPLHMSGMSAIERAMSDIRPSMEYAHDIMQQVQVATAVPSMISEITEVLRSARISSVSEAYERYASVMMSSRGNRCVESTWSFWEILRTEFCQNWRTRIWIRRQRRLRRNMPVHMSRIGRCQRKV